MKLELNRPEFLKAWQMAERSVNVKGTGGASDGILLTAGETTILEATDGKTAIRCEAAGVEVIVPGTSVLPVRLLGEFLKKMPTENVSLEIDRERGTLAAGRNRMRFTTAPASEFPKIPRSDGGTALCEILAADLARVIAEGSIASSATTTEYPLYIGACLFSVKDGGLKAVSTDGKRLSLSQCPCEAQSETKLLLPISALKELSRLLAGSDQESRVQVLQDGSMAWFRMEG